jgi:hydrogenase maturation protein HypF
MSPAVSTNSPIVRLRLAVQGQIQGVGFRPFVYRLAHRYGLAGFVRNDAAGVVLEVQGPAESVERFSRALVAERPPLAIFFRINRCDVSPCGGEAAFVIEASDRRDADAATAAVTVDTALCPDCLRELFDARDRRSGYALINCTNCGPRYSIIERIPYDRPHTTMARFDMCDACRDEYTRPGDRRFHAQPIACHDCGPTLRLVDPAGTPIDGDPVRNVARRLDTGEIVAIKGLGGFHLAVRADDEQAVQRLRQRKHRDAKPLAVMCRSIDDARALVCMDDEAVELLASPQAPIVLAARRHTANIADNVAPDNARLGVMLPYTPIHHLLFAELNVPALVMTSGNRSDEPLVIDNDEAVERLGDLCDAILWHDRPIARCVDDSVWLSMPSGKPVPVRRARGYAPAPLALPVAAQLPGVCLGGELKNTVAVVRREQAIVSQHLGDLTHALALQYFKQAIDDLSALFEVKPQWIAHDMHPLYLSTAHAKQLAEQWGVPRIEVQHHHAHAAAVLAEHGRTGPALAIICDGVGYGSDGGIWGGELLLADLVDFQRLAHLRPLRLPGGDAAARDTRRCALALLEQIHGDAAGERPEAKRLLPDDGDRTLLAAMLRSDTNCPASTAAGRVFDGVAALLGVCERNRFEAEAPIALEHAAAGAPDDFTAHQWFGFDGEQIDLAPLIERMMVPGDVAERAAMFHDQFARAFCEAAAHHGDRTGVRDVVLSGGVMCNERITTRLTDLLTQRGLTVLRHEQVPPTDGGLSLGQAAVAAARIAKGGL